MTLVLSFGGWCQIRLATDPDPTDEPRGVSGYTFAFGNEPDLDRVLRFQPDPAAVRRPHPDPLGVFVQSAVRTDTNAQIPQLAGATVDLVDEPRLENRNWTLTQPGFEPIVPFHIRIAKDRFRIARDVPLNPQDPTQPVWQASAGTLAAQAAAGIVLEPQTVGAATGIWDPLAEAGTRIQALEEMRAAEHAKRRPDPDELLILDARLGQLEEARQTQDRRIGVRTMIERFTFALAGPARVADPGEWVGAKLHTRDEWSIEFWMGGWDADLLCCYVQGALQIPFAQ